MGRLVWLVLWAALLVVAIVAVGMCSKYGIGVTPNAGGRAVPPLNQQQCPLAAPIKGTFSRVYHIPGGLLYDRTDPHVCFVTVGDAEAVGYRRSQN